MEKNRPPATPEFRAASFVQYAESKSRYSFLVRGIHGKKESIAGILIIRKDGKEFPITQAIGIVEALDDKAQELGGQKIGKFAPLNEHDPKQWYGFYEFNVQRLERSGSLR